jgi:hypothetical protein
VLIIELTAVYNNCSYCKDCQAAQRSLITGAMLPSKLWKVGTSYFAHIGQLGASNDSQIGNTKSAGIWSQSSSSDEPKEAVDEQKDDHDNSSRGMHPEPDLERLVKIRDPF